MLCMHGTAAVAATGPRGQSAAVLIRRTLGTAAFDNLHSDRPSLWVLDMMMMSSDLHGARGNVRQTSLGIPVAVAAAVPERDDVRRTA